MGDIITLFNTLIQYASRAYISDNISLLDDLILDKYEKLDDAELKNKIRNCHSRVIEPKSRAEALFKGFVTSIKKIFRLTTLDPYTIELLALGVEAFKRCPADLPTGSFLYKSQMIAATALNERCVIQMDTGEGKTYAILPAAFSLFIRFGKVYVICANEYLAERDAKRTKSYWDFVGLSIGLALYNKTSEENWNADIVYTTLDSLVFKYMGDEKGLYKPEFPLQFSACIIDEADAVVLDQSWGVYSLIQYVNSNLFDWGFAFNFIQSLKRGEEIHLNESSFTCFLTEIGEEKLKREYGKDSLDFSGFQVLKKAVELSYLGLVVAEEGTHYVMDKGRIYPFDNSTGKVKYNSTPEWVIPLEIHRGINPRPEKITVHSITANILLKKFFHLSGISGSITSDTVEYLFAYWLPCLIIPRRTPRYKGLRDDLVFKSKKEAINYACEEIVKSAISEQRPVLVGCQNINEVQFIYENINSQLPPQYSIYPILGKDDEDVAHVFEQGGELGSVIIGTQLSGRGVDIRLSEEAKKNGGLALISLGHSEEMRYDQQFLGRAGRQNDPFSAVFCVSLEDDLMKRFQSEKISKIMDAIGHKENDVISHSMVTQSIVRAQNVIRKENFFKRRSQDYQENTLINIYEDLSKLYKLQQEGNNESKNSYWESNSFIDYVIDSFIEVNISPYCKNHINIDDAQKIVAVLVEKTLFQFPEHLIYEIEGRKRDYVVEKIKKELTGYIIKTFESSAHKEQEYTYFMQEWSELHNKYNKLKSIFTRIENIDFKPNEAKELPSGEHANDNGLLKFEDYIIDESFEAIINENMNVDDKLNVERLLPLIEDSSLPLSTQMGLHADSSHSFTFFNYQKFIRFRQEIEQRFHHFNEIFTERFQKEYQSYGLYLMRIPPKIINLSITRMWMRFIEEKERLTYKIGYKISDPIEYNRVLSEKLIELWEKEKNNLPHSILRNFEFLNSINKLDDLFIFEDNNINYFEDNISAIYDWADPSASKFASNISSLQDADLRLVDEYLSQTIGELGKYDLNKIKNTLVLFIKLNPIGTLNTRIKIQKALESWFRKEIDEGVEKSRRQLNHYWIKKFLRHINERGLTASLPGLFQKLSFLSGDVIKNVLDIKTVLHSLQLVLTLLLFSGVAIFWNAPNSIHLSGAELYLDYWLTGGLISNSIPAGPIVLGLIIANYFANRSSGLNTGIAILISVSLCFFMLWEPGSLLNIAGSVFCVLLTVYLTNFFKVSWNNTYRILGIDVLKFWLSFSTIYFVFHFWHWSSKSVIFLLISIVYFVWYKWYNTTELVFMSTRFSKSAVSMESEQIRTGYQIRGSSSLPMVLSFVSLYLFTFIIGKFHSGLYSYLYEGFPLFYFFLTISYFLIAIVLIKNTINNKTLFLEWKKKAFNRNETLVDENDQELNLSAVLNKLARVFWLRETVFFLFLLSLVSFIFKDMTLELFEFPVSLVILTGAVFFVENFHASLSQLNSILISRMPTSFEIVDLSKVPAVKEDKTFIETLKDFFESTNKLASFLKILIGIILAIFYSYKFFKSIGWL